jgi:hypothetical protein
MFINENALNNNGIQEYIKSIKNDAFVKMLNEQRKQKSRKSRNTTNQNTLND